MALLQILRYPDPRLKTVAKPVTQFDEQLDKLVYDMSETMYRAPGVGLAATQVNVHLRVIVVDVSETKDSLMGLINPEIISASAECVPYEEGCLSVPGIYDEVQRPANIRVRAHNVRGELVELDASGLLAVCIQHEIDHLNGKVFVEYLSQLKQTRIRTKLKKQEKDQQPT